MVDQFTETSTVGYGNRIGQSFKNVLFGLIIFLASFGVLFWNEGRYDLSLLAQKSVPVQVAQVDPTQNGHLVALTGEVMTSDSIGDNLYITPGHYLALERSVETYAWVEKTSTKSTNNTGGSETNEKTYSYSKEWTTRPKSSSEFQHPEGHENISPANLILPMSVRAQSATIGAYTIGLDGLTLPSLEAIAITPENSLLDSKATTNGQYVLVFQTGSTMEAPTLGDQRLSYSALNPGFTGTVYGEQNGATITPFTDEAGHTLFNLSRGSRGEGITSLHSDFILWSWIWRLVGFLMMWFGLSLLFGWVSMLANILPFLGSATGLVIALATFVAALALSLVTIVVSMIAHSIVAVVIAGLIVAGVLVFWAKRRKPVPVMQGTV